jgi:hypothetical protein
MANDEITYDRPVAAKLLVRLETGEEWLATAEDLAKFGYANRIDAYIRWDNHLTGLLADAGLIRKDLTTARLNPLRYLVELALSGAVPLDDPDLADVNQRTVEIERT